MRRSSLIIALVVAVVAAPFVRAEDQPLSDEHLNVIRTNCINAQPSFYRVQQADKTARINRGYNYEMTLRLMVAFNSRAALNRVDSPDLLTITSNYERTLKEFTALYTQYDENLSELAEFSCREQPTAFYDLLRTTRDQRARLNVHVTDMDKRLNDYQKAVDAIKKNTGVARS
jgi:hypothetical protein